MSALGPSPRNRLNTGLNSYLFFLDYVLNNRSSNNKKCIEDFENALCEFFSTQYAVCVSQCRVGLYLAIKALIKPGQDVILSPYTVDDVINMIIFAGGVPVFADVNRESCNISSSEVEKLIHSNTGAVLITHLHGLAAEAHQIKEICDRFNVPMVEDCAQSFGVYEQGKPVGTIGDVGVFSFEMHKNITTWLGGAVISDRADIIHKIQTELRDFDYDPLPNISKKIKKGSIHDLSTAPIIFQLLTYPILRFSYLNSIKSVNDMARRQPQKSDLMAQLPEHYKCLYTSFQARIGLSQLQNNIDTDIKRRIENGLLYYESLKDIDELIVAPSCNDGSNTYLWFPIQYCHRDELLKFMFKRGRDIAAGHFKNNADSVEFKAFYRDCPNARQIEHELIYLPTYPQYSHQEITKTIQAIRQYFSS